MITITCSKDLYTYNAYHLAKAFFPEEVVKVSTDAFLKASVIFDISGLAARHSGGLSDKGNNKDNFGKDDAEAKGTCKDSRRIVIGDAKTKDEIDKEIYRDLSEFTGRTLPWGLLTGVRPTKPAMTKLKQGMGKDEFISWYGKEKLVSRQKAALAWDIAKKELDILNKIVSSDKKAFKEIEAGALPCALKGKTENLPEKVKEKEFSSEENIKEKEPLKGDAFNSKMPSVYAADNTFRADTCSIYIGIPFCPGICSYCSFSLGTISRFADKTDDYISALCTEIKGLSELCKGKNTTSIYIGGGTPTSLSAAQLERLMQSINENFDVPSLWEFCVEAGRPDTITKEKLSVLKEYGADRISINPQTMQQKTLDRVGRCHSVKQVYEAFDAARQNGFDNINMDLIAGLPEESAPDMADTLKKVLELSPESLTVHALSIKRRAAMKSISVSSDEVYKMIDLAHEAAYEAGLSPYYLYRQKSIAGNFENTGYAKPGREGLYNILMMEEVQTIFGLGAGADTKVVFENPVPNPERRGKPARILRCSNIKDIDGYINNIEEMINKKKVICETMDPGTQIV